MKTCPICKTEFDNGGDVWKKVCRDCFKNFRFLHYDKHPVRIKNYGYKIRIYLSHPSVTQEEIDAWIKAKGHDVGWGAQEWKPENWKQLKIWIDDVNFD